MQRSVFTTEDPAEGLAVLEEVYGTREVRRTPDSGFSMTMSSLQTGPVTHGRMRMRGSSAAGTTEGVGVLRVCHLLGGMLSATSPGHRFPRTGPFLFPQRAYTTSWEDLEAMTVSLDPAAVADHAHDLLGADAFRLEFTGIRPVSPDLARYWGSTITHLHRDLLPHPEAMSSPLLQGEAVRSVTTALLHTFPNTFLERTQAPARQPAGGSGAVRRAVAFIDAHLDTDIGLAEIAAAARMSPRGLQAAFRREKGTTPTAYLRTARLDAAHRDLVAADPTTGMTVAAIAARWGFAHTGRFATTYRDRHGQSPSTTLHT